MVEWTETGFGAADTAGKLVDGWLVVAFIYMGEPATVFVGGRQVFPLSREKEDGFVATRDRSTLLP